jgi:integrase
MIRLAPTLELPGERTISLGPVIAGALFEHRARSRFQGDDERVFCSVTGGPIDVSRYARTFRRALELAGITDRVRPFHDQRHSSITNDAARRAPR